MRVTSGSDIGLVRTNNEDSYYCSPPHLFVVADGMGGHQAGEVASSMLVAEVKNSVIADGPDHDIEGQLRSIICAANKAIKQKAVADEQFSGMGTTATLLYLTGKKYFWAHIGDSRIYRYRTTNLEQITMDHSLVNIWVKTGTITPKEAMHHPKKNILMRAVGVEDEIEVDTGSGDLKEGDIFLLATDGLTNMVNDREIAAILQDENIADKAQCFLEKANKAGGLDNITAIVIEI